MTCLHEKLVAHRRQKFHATMISPGIVQPDQLAMVEYWEVYCSECGKKLDVGVKNQTA